MIYKITQDLILHACRSGFFEQIHLAGYSYTYQMTTKSVLGSFWALKFLFPV